MVFFLSLLTASFLASVWGEEYGRMSCQCVPTNLCGDSNVEISGQGLLDIRSQSSKCRKYYEVCCENPLIDIGPPPEHAIYRGCGSQTPVVMLSRITSDSKYAEIGELPWIILVLLRDVEKTGRNMYKCGGSLIHPQVVLTAAHCIYEINATLLTVRAGEWNTKSQEEPFPHQDRSVEDTLVHPDFHPGSLKNDIGLIFLNEPFFLTANVGLVCLPPPFYQMEDATCTAAGWGKKTMTKGKYSTILKKVQLALVGRDLCVEMLRSTRLGVFYQLDISFICAGGELNRDTCKGDGGSPLTCPIPGAEERSFQMGIVAWGIGCGELDVPGVYVNVPLFTQWIDDELKARDLETSFYKYL